MIKVKFNYLLYKLTRIANCLQIEYFLASKMVVPLNPKTNNPYCSIEMSEFEINQSMLQNANDILMFNTL